MNSFEDFSRAPSIKPSSDRTFGLVMGAALLLIGLAPLRTGHTPRWLLLALSAGFLLCAAIAPPVLHPLNRAWTWLGKVLHAVVTPVVTGLIFFLVFTPVALVRRLAAKDGLRLRPDAAAKTYWLERTPPGPPPDSMINQF